jgi:hypothetical protein
MRAARMAGNSPPTSPTSSASAMPCATNIGLSRKLNTTWVKLAPGVDAVKPSKISRVAAAPIAPPIAA